MIFDNFRQSYSQSALSSCGKNFVFRPNSGAIDLTGDNNLFNCTCPNCDTGSYIICDPNDANQIGWFGGCGDIICTGKQNYLVHDFNGTFLPFKGVIIPNNPTIGNGEYNCTFSSSMNGHLCQR